MLKKVALKSYLLGLGGVASSLPEAVAYIKNVLPIGAYSRTTTIGTSGGGYAAILTAILMGCDRGVSVCGRTQTGFSDFEALKLSSNGSRAGSRRPNLCYIFGSENTGDALAALALRDDFGGRLYPVPMVSNHNVIHELLKRGHLSEVLNDVLGSN